MSVWMEYVDGEFTEFIYIPFTRDEWAHLLEDIKYAVRYGEVDSYADAMELNIIDRIEKGLGEE